MIENSYHLPAGYSLTVSAIDGKVFVRQVEDDTIAAAVTNAAAQVFGPYLYDRNFIVQDTGNVAGVVIAVENTLPSVAQKALLDAIPTADQTDGVTIWNDAGVLKVSTSA